jgi:hypothetical protein
VTAVFTHDISTCFDRGKQLASDNVISVIKRTIELSLSVSINYLKHSIQHSFAELLQEEILELNTHPEMVNILEAVKGATLNYGKSSMEVDRDFKVKQSM